MALSSGGHTLKPYFTRRNELRVHAECLLWGSRIIIPLQGREEVMKVLHETPWHEQNEGISTKLHMVAEDGCNLKERVKSCEVCQAHQKTPAPVPLHRWKWLSCPWSRIHIDYAGPFMGKMFLLIIDAHSKWLDVHYVNSATTETTIEKLRAAFATPWLNRDDSIRQWFRLHERWIQSFHAEEWHTARYLRTILCLYEWTSRKGGADFQTRYEEAREREHRDKARTFSVELTYNASDNYRGITRSTTVGPQPEVTPGSVKGKCWNES